MSILINDNGKLGNKEIYAEYGAGVFPDGFEFDSEGGIWCTSVVSNRIIRIGKDGEQVTVFDEGDEETTAKAEADVSEDTYTREHLKPAMKAYWEIAQVLVLEVSILEHVSLDL